MLSDDHWPQEAPWDRAIVHWSGVPYQSQRLRGAGGPGCWKVLGPKRQLILKTQIPQRERIFYEQFAPRLRAQGILTPALYAFGTNPEWIILEWMRDSLSPVAWGRDSQVFFYLAKWHEVSPDILDGFDGGFHFQYPGLSQKAVISLLPKGAADKVLGLINRFHDEFTVILRAKTWVHGDTNPTNWLVNANKTPVLVDWSRYGQAHPAIDVAIFLPGLPTPRLINLAATRYVHMTSSPCIETQEEFAKHVALAKLWSVIDFLDMAWRHELSDAAQNAILMLQRSLSDWIEAVFGI